ncbi:host attachment protein [Micavibrio aeruginosavorus]|uniref:host attachment protein n=1 Tax=Micavibrio aeruginosavorus TaxID=349221 RepID=UPI003F4A953D
MKLTGQLAEQNHGAFAPSVALHAGIKTPRVWIVVADKHGARIFEKIDRHLKLIGEASPDQNLQDGLNNQTIGRAVSSGGSTIHHKYEPHMEQERAGALDFAHDLAAFLDEADTAREFDRLVLVAAPRTLGDLRAVISKHVQRHITAQVDKNLTKLDERALGDALEDVLWL